MLAWISFKACFDFAIKHSSHLSWLAFFLGWIPVLIAQGEVREKIKDASGVKRWIRRAELWFLFLIPVIAFIATKASEGASDRADDRITSLEKSHKSDTNKLAALESDLQPRAITDKQKQVFIDYLKNAPKCPIHIHCGNVDNETKNFAYQISGMLESAGYATGGMVVFDLGNGIRTTQFSGILLCATTTNFQDEVTVPPYFEKIKNAFGKIGISTLGETPTPLPQAYPVPDEFRKQMLKNNPSLEHPCGLETAPGEIAIIVNDKAY